jgi:5'-3' exoribonuclease 1
MLGLVTHEMHFALLREEVKYGPKKISKMWVEYLILFKYVFVLLISPTPEEINWHLLQLCLLRDYIDLEFRSAKVKIFINSLALKSILFFKRKKWNFHMILKI